MVDRYYEGFDDYSSNSSSKTIKVYKNGDPNLSFDLKLNSEYRPRDVMETIETKLKLQPVQKLRLFTVEGLEVSLEELAYVKAGETIFASRGENFDKSSTLVEYELLKNIGEGGFGEVKLYKHKISKEKVAIKFLKASRTMANEVNKLFAEAETLKNLHHKNIVKVINCFSLSTMQVAFIMEYLEGGELKEYVEKRGKLSEDEAREFFKQIAEAVSYCHRNRFIHCDLKLENILLESQDSKVVKVVDFGISGLCSNLQADTNNSGSLDYMAPEYFNGSTKGVHAGVDIWALGCMLYGMVTGSLPFWDNTEDKKIERICSAKVEYGEAGKKLSREIKHLISRMLEVDIEQRLHIHDVLDHPWMTGEKLPDIVEEAKIEGIKKTASQNSSPGSTGSSSKKPSPSTGGKQFSFNLKSTTTATPPKKNLGLGSTSTSVVGPSIGTPKGTSSFANSSPVKRASGETGKTTKKV